MFSFVIICSSTILCDGKLGSKNVLLQTPSYCLRSLIPDPPLEHAYSSFCIEVHASSFSSFIPTIILPTFKFYPFFKVHPKTQPLQSILFLTPIDLIECTDIINLTYACALSQFCHYLRILGELSLSPKH